MKIIEQFIVSKSSQWHVLYHLENDTWFMTSTGAFQQRDMYIEQIEENEAKKLLALMVDSAPIKI
jgi:hypothetical protein